MHDRGTTKLDRKRLPRHIGIMLGGVARWRAANDAAPVDGYRESLRAGRKILAEAAGLGIGYLSLYPVPDTTWLQSPPLVRLLLRIVLRDISKDPDFYRKHDIRIRFSGNLDGLDARSQSIIRRIQESTEELGGLNVNVVVGADGRKEIVRAANRWLGAQAHAADFTGQPSSGQITDTILARHLDLPDFPEPDLIIRTGGESRMGDFLLWESAYSEFIFHQKAWPEWTGDDLIETIVEFQRRSRRFGGT